MLEVSTMRVDLKIESVFGPFQKKSKQEKSAKMARDP